MVTDRPGARGPAPEGSKRSGERQAGGYFGSRGMTKAEPQAGENSRRTPLPGRSRGAASDPGQTSPSQDDRTDLPKTDTRERTPADATDTQPDQAAQGRAAPPHRLTFLGRPDKEARSVELAPVDELGGRHPAQDRAAHQT